MPGEDLEDALAAAEGLRGEGLAAVLTFLGENVTDEAEAEQVTLHYCKALDRARELNLDCHLSVKLTQLGLDLGPELCSRNLTSILWQASRRESFVWIDMEDSSYTDTTLDLFRRALREHNNVGLCLQAYLHRTARDLEDLLPRAPALRLVKGAYAEPPDVAFRKKRDVDENYFSLAARMLRRAGQEGFLPAIATHDRRLMERIREDAGALDLGMEKYEFQMLYGIQRAQQIRLAREGHRVRVLISYGSFWFPWFLRRLAERPANLFFILRNFFRR